MTNVPQQPPDCFPKAAAVTSNSRPVVVFNYPEGIEARVGWGGGLGGWGGGVAKQAHCHRTWLQKKPGSVRQAPTGANLFTVSALMVIFYDAV